MQITESNEKDVCGYKNWTSQAKHYSKALKRFICTKCKFFYFEEKKIVTIEPPDEVIENVKWMKSYLNEVRKYAVNSSITDLYPEFIEEFNGYVNRFDALSNKLSKAIDSSQKEKFYKIRVKLEFFKDQLNSSQWMHDIKDFKFKSDIEAQIQQIKMKEPILVDTEKHEILKFYKEDIATELHSNYEKKISIEK